MKSDDVNACWSKIGVQGDHSCLELETHAHCRNCPTFSSSAKLFLNSPIPEEEVEEWTRHFATPEAVEKAGRRLLVFQLGREWFALDLSFCVEVVDDRAAHSLPHRPNPALEGIVNIRGNMVLLVSLAALLGTPTAAGPAPKRRLLLLQPTDPIAIRVDAIETIAPIDPETIARPPETNAMASTSAIRGVFTWKNHQVGWLDESQLSRQFAQAFA